MREKYPKYPVISRNEYQTGELAAVSLLLHPKKQRPAAQTKRRQYIYDIDIVRNPFGTAFR